MNDRKLIAWRRYQKAASKGNLVRDDGRIILLNTSHFDFGRWQPPFEYTAVDYSTDDAMFRLSNAGRFEGFKVSKYGRSYRFAARSFIAKQLLPTGLYQRVDDEEYIYQHISKVGR